jgi:hypothetical protein
LTESAATYWLDFGTGWSLENLLSGSGASERWISLDAASGSVSSATTLSFTFLHQYYVVIQPSAAGGGDVTPSGWYNATASVSISATPGSGWQFEGWYGVGLGSYSGSDRAPSITISSAIVENATFYPGLTIDVGANGRVFCSYGGVSLTIDSGAKTIYVPMGTNVSITASPSSFLYQFDGFEYEHSGLVPFQSASSAKDTGSATVDAPSTVRATFGYNYVNFAAIVGVLAAAAAASVLMLRRHRVKAIASPSLPQS